MRLNQVMNQIRGLSYDKKDVSNNQVNGNIPVLRAGNIQDTRIIYEDLVFVPKEIIKEKQLLQYGDILIAASSGSISIVGKAAMFRDNFEITFGAFCKVLRPDKSKIDFEYFKHFFETDYYKRTIKSLAEGANINNLKTEHFDELEIPLPPMKQQKKIAAILDAADAYRQKTKTLIAKYDELTQSLFLDMFGDPVKNEKGWEKLSGRIVFKLIGGAAFKSSDYTSHGLPLIRIGTVNKGYFDNAQLTFLPNSFEKSHSKYLVYPNDLLITLTGTVGKDDYGNAFVLTNEFEKYLLNQRVAKICNSEKHNLLFLKFFLKQKKIKNELIGVSRGVRQANLSNEDFYKLETITPPLTLQNQFAKRVQAIETQKAQAQASLEKAEELFNSLLRGAFKRELV